jgi:ribosome biogenesis GTPase / thiamine phosphate phosphatase
MMNILEQYGWNDFFREYEMQSRNNTELQVGRVISLKGFIYHLMRIDRYLVQVIACGIQPVVILNKSDLTDDPQGFLREVARLGKDCPVRFCSTYRNEGVDTMYDQVLKSHLIYILILSSGVGKSSLVNTLMNTDDRQTGPVSLSAQKGRHVTSTRDLFSLPNGSLLIDTPGMREFGQALDEDLQLEGLFPVIEALAGSCRYADCLQVNESGCAVIAAYENGNVDTALYNSYLKLMREQKRFQIRVEDKKHMGKQFGKMSREAKEFRQKYNL